MNAQHGRKLAAVAAAIGFGLSLAPARAGDDGQASLLSGMASTFGITKPDDPRIDYRERPKIVLPPKKTLPPPGASAARDPSWPTDVETVRERKRKKMEDAEPSARDRANGRWRLINPGDDVKVTTSGFEESGPACRNPDPKTGECPGKAQSDWSSWNPMTWVGLQKKPPSILGPEPDRDSLIDPPKGYRAPAEGVGAKVENN